MNKEQYIRSRFKDLLNETLEERTNDIKKNLSKKVRLNPKNKFDYIEEGKGMCESCGGMMTEGKCNEGCNLEENKSICESCGGMVNEGENCEECGSMYNKGDIQELGGMDDGHPRFGKENFNQMTKSQVERLLRGDDDDDENDYGNLSMYNPYYGDDANMDDDDMGYDDDDDFEFKTPVRDAIRSHKGRFKTPVRDAIRSHKGRFKTPVRDAIRSRGNRLRDLEDDMSEGVNFQIDEKLYGNQSRIDKNKNNRIDSEDFKMLRKQQDEEQLYEIDFEKEENTEGNAFTGALSNAKKHHKDEFKVGGKKFKVKESILYTESDLLDLIENLVIEEKNTFKKSEPKGYKEYERVHNADKKENDNYLKSVAKKMTDYLKGSSDSGSKYEMKVTKKFPTENGGMKKGIRKKYTPSDAVDEYIEAFSYPGQTNLVYDEIKPNDEKIKGQLVGSSTNGNAQVDKDGNALGNVVPSEVGDRFYNNFKDNLYGQEQMNASYKRQPQPVDQAGEETERGTLKSKRGKKTSQSVLNKLEESLDLKSQILIGEEFKRIHNLMGYNRKTQ
jgi:hypothetical protein